MTARPPRAILSGTMNQALFAPGGVTWLTLPRFIRRRDGARGQRAWIHSGAEQIDATERRGIILAVLSVLAAGVAARCGRWDWWVRDRMGQDDRTPEGAIKRMTLDLCTLIATHCPKGKRLESALGSIRAGVRLALEEREYAKHKMVESDEGTTVRS